MLRGRSLLLLVLLGCGGRDPLLGVNDEGVLVPPVMGGSGGTSTGGTPGTVPPVVNTGPDAGTVPPPVQRDAAPAKADAPPANPTPTPGMCAFPKCVAALQEACTPKGMCTQQRVSGGGAIGTNVCFTNGVRLITNISGNGRNVTIRVMRPDGSGCYTIEPESRGGGVTGLNYRTPSGELVATATRDRGRLSVTCIGTTTPVVVEDTCQPGLVLSGCGAGACQ